MGKKNHAPTTKVEAVPQPPQRCYELKFRNYSKNAIRPFKIVDKISSGVVNSRYYAKTGRLQFIPISKTLAVRGRNLYDLESREKIADIDYAARDAKYIGYVTAHEMHFCVPRHGCFLYDLKTSMVIPTPCKMFIKNYAYSNGWNLDTTFNENIHCALKECLVRVQRLQQTRTSVISFKNGDDEHQITYQGIINQVYALHETQFVACTDTKVLIFDSISHDLKKEYKFPVKRPVRAVFPISPLFIGVVTVSRVRVIEAYSGNVYCESLIDEGCFGSQVVMGMDPDTLFIESAGGKQIYILKMISMECGIKDKEYLTDTDFWFQTEEH
jgi:hypothetical protein